jgi:hypothetical protein
MSWADVLTSDRPLRQAPASSGGPATRPTRLHSGRTLQCMGFWLTIEIQHGEIGADGWRRAHGESLIEAAVTNGARGWEWHTPQWGLILEVELSTEQARDAFRNLPAVTAALDAVPDPVFGLLVYPGRGGGSGAAEPRRPRPAPAAGAAELDEPRDRFLNLVVDR